MKLVGQSYVAVLFWVVAGACQSADNAAPIVTVKREVYVPNTDPKTAPWVNVFTGKDGYREEIHTRWSHAGQEKGYGDSPGNPFRRITRDNGKTWSDLVPLPPITTFFEGGAVIDWKFCGIYDPASDRHVALSIHHIRDMRQGPPRMIYNHALIRLSDDDGETFGPAEVLKYEPGADLDSANALNPEYLENNPAYPGQSIHRLSNGNLLIPVTNARIPADVEDEVIGNTKWPSKGTIGALCFIGKWNAEAKQYEWDASNAVWLPRSLAFNGLLEADVAEMKDGRVLMVFRVTKGKDQPAYKWFSLSEDAGKTFAQPAVFTYSDGSHFYSGSNFHRLFRSRKTGKLYWIGNIVPEAPTNPGHPRYPLIIAEVDETKAALKKETVTVIDTRQPGDGEMMQLSNFWMVEDTETFDLEIHVPRLGEDPAETFHTPAYRYTLSFRE
jgi:hypothetical protein